MNISMEQGYEWAALMELVFFRGASLSITNGRDLEIKYLDKKFVMIDISADLARQASFWLEACIWKKDHEENKDLWLSNPFHE